ncbi:MAG: energy transducer TonB [Burkholderiales bacterium]
MLGPATSLAAQAEAPWQSAGGAAWRLSPATLGLALALSVVLHGLALTIERNARTPGADGSRLKATLRVAMAPATSPSVATGAAAVSESAAPRHPGDPEPAAATDEALARQLPQQANSSADQASPASANAAAGAEAWLGLDTPQPVPLPRFDADSYLPPSRVQSAAQPYNEDLFDTLPLSGSVPGRWLARLFIGEHGRIDRIEIVEATGSPHNEEELRRALEAAVFRPAMNGQEAVRSQRTLMISFDPPPVLPTDRSSPSASGK